MPRVSMADPVGVDLTPTAPFGSRADRHPTTFSSMRVGRDRHNFSQDKSLQSSLTNRSTEAIIVVMGRSSARPPLCGLVC